MYFKDLPPIERLNPKTGKFEQVSSIVHEEAMRICAIFKAEEEIYDRIEETENWKKNIRGGMHIEYN